MDLILVNGKIHTMEKDCPWAEAVAIREGKFVKVGSNEEVLLLKAETTEVVDLGGRVLLPGFNDSHMHLLSFGSSLRKAQLGDAKSIDEIVERVREFINEKNIENGKWVSGRGWNHDYFDVEKRFPNRYDLDKISAEHPIVLTRACGHVCVVNSRAMEIAGVTKETDQVEGGHFDLDENGEPLGIFREKALSLIYDSMPGTNLEDVKAMIRYAAAYANSKGLTSVQTDDFDQVSGIGYRDVIRAYNELKEGGELTLRIYEQCLFPGVQGVREFINDGYSTGHGDAFFKIGPLKILADGSLGARTAALCEPYADDTSTSGILIYSQQEIDEMVELAHNSGTHVAIHCIGDKTMYQAFESIEKVLRKKPRENHRHSIVHCQITDEVLLNKYSELDVIAHIQPIFLHYDLHMVEERIGRERAKKTYAFKTMLEKGVHIALGTDCPVEPLDVMPNIYCAVTRQDLKGYPEEGWLSQEKLTVEEAVYNYTLGSAYASFEEDIKGSISEGKLADMVVLSEDIFAIEPSRIKDVEVEMTFLGGKIVYRRA
jgi:predicted amidohydrolase YtcJ